MRIVKKATKKAEVKQKTVVRRVRQMAYTDYGRSALVNMTKLEVAQLIVEQQPGLGFARIYTALKPTSKKAKRRIQTLESKGRGVIDALMHLTKAELVDLSYEGSDTRLNRLYRQGHVTLGLEVRDDVKSTAFVLKNDRPIELDSNSWEENWKTREKSPIKLRFRKTKKVEPREKKKWTANDWISSLRKHNKFMAHDSNVR